MASSDLTRMPFGLAPEGYRGPLVRLAPGSLGGGGLLVNTGATDAQLDSLPVWDGGLWLQRWQLGIAVLTAAAMVSWAVPAVAWWPQAASAALLAVLGLCHFFARQSWRGRHALVMEVLAPVLAPVPFTGQGRRSMGGRLVAYFTANQETGGTLDERQLRFEIAHHVRAFTEVYGTQHEAAGFESLLRAEAALKDLADLGEPLVAPATAVPEFAAA